MTDNKFNALSQGIITSLTDNRFFPDLSPYLKDFKKAYDEYFNAIPPANMRSTATVAVKNSLRDKATTELIRLSMMVEYQANFNLEALESSGFELANKPKSKGQVGLVNDIRMKTNGVEGLVMVTCDRDPNARTYKARISTDQVNWTWFNAAPTRTVNVYNVPKGVKLYVQMQLQNAHGFSPWSASVMGEIPTDHMITSVHE